ncbi:hypothetical protein J8TS2_30430 [Lederbergia ruris]|uniref:Uncharacterized protein n=1 Tax=Lederbergia ruris TaxID=217495 RepID=A0ABQ4KMJ4_9BACI|nr:hypothetical protein J8TS2_30430 [Lederbergia ruris]
MRDDYFILCEWTTKHDTFPKTGLSSKTRFRFFLINMTIYKICDIPAIIGYNK